MFRLGNLGGVIYKDDMPLVRFKFDRDTLVDGELLNTDKSILPFEFMNGDVDERTVRKFFESRITPDSRQGIHEMLKDTPIKYYHPERMIRYNNGKCIHDKYWVKCDNDNRCWKN